MDWQKLRTELQGNLVLPTDQTYDLLRRPFNWRIDPTPAAVARCVSEDDVIACVRFAIDNGLAVTTRSGGHGTEGYCSIDGALMIDQSAMQEIRLDTEANVVHVGAGAEWGQVDLATYPRGLATPGGGCQAVGVAGLTQGGGFGPIARTHGLAIDNLLSVRIVTSRDQQVIVADATTNKDLFWAVRGGGGGNFGSVTQFTYRLHPIGRALLGGMLIYAWTDIRQVFQFYRDWMNSTDADPALTLLPIFGFGPGNSPVGLLSAFYNGDYDIGLAYIEEIFAAAKMPTPLNQPPGVPLGAVLGPGTLPAYTGTESTTAWPGSGQYWRSGYLKNDFPDAAIDTFMTWFAQCPMPPADRVARPIPAGSYKQNDLSFGFIESLGGKIADVGRTDTAFYWRDQRFSFTFIAIYDPADDAWAVKSRQWADDFRNAMAPYFSGGVYVNYMQAELPNWETAYYGENYDQLRKVKLKYDPEHVFRFPQDVLAGHSPASSEDRHTPST